MIDYKNELKKILNSTHGYNFLDIDSEKPIILYGAGSLGELAIDLLKEKDITPTAIIDRGKEGKIKNIPISKITDLSSYNIEKSLFIICISSIKFKPIYEDLKKIGCKSIIHFYDYSEYFFKEILGNGWSKSNISSKDIENIKIVLKALEHDNNSIAHYLQFLWWKSRRIEYIYDNYPILSNKKYFNINNFISLNNKEKYLDAGAHHGNSILDFILKTNNQYMKIWAFEPDEYNMNILKLNTKKLKNIEYISHCLSDTNKSIKFYDNLGYASKIDKKGKIEKLAKTIDSFNIEPTIIKLHLEGEELKTLKGAINTINKYRPIIMVLADHNEDGLYKIANFLINLEKYKLYFYLHDYCGNSAIFYAYPKERTKND